MKINVANLPEELRLATLEVFDQLHIEESARGYMLRAKEGDCLSVVFDGRKCEITYSKTNEYFRGLKNFIQRNPCEAFSIQEQCTVNELGIMMDCSRNAVPNVAHLKEVIRTLALMGYNQLQLYTEDTYEVENEPYFGYMRGRYSMAEMREIDDYAFLFGIEVVPCIQTLAHLNQIFRWPEYSKINDIADILLIDDDRTYQLIDNMFSTLSKCFRSKKIHIGMDEAHFVGRGLYEDKHGATENRSQLLIHHLNKVIKIAEKYEYKPMIWSDMFFRLVSGGTYYVDESVKIPQDVINKVPENLRLVYWDYYTRDPKIYQSMIKHHKAFNREIMFAGGAWKWMGFTPQNRFSISTTRMALENCEKFGVNKVMLTMWGDNGAECSDLSVLPTLCMTAEYVYGHKDEYAQAFKAVTGVTLQDFMTLDLPNVLDEEEEENRNNRQRYMLYNDCIGGWLDYVPQGGENAVYESHAKRIREAGEKAGRYSYLFDTQAAICDVLAVKFELGKQTREAYLRNDRQELQRLIDESYVPLVGKLNAFYVAFEKQWGLENKPFGFEIQDYRIGGLTRRVEHCIKRLKDYLSGNVNDIPELEGEILNPFPLLPTNGWFMMFDWNISANKL